MLLKSWAFKYRDHRLRAEIWWRLTGWSRQRLYVDHELLAEQCGFSLVGLPLRGESGFAFEVVFHRLGLGLDLDCRVYADGTEIPKDGSATQVEKKWAHFAAEDDGTAGTTLGPLIGCILGAPLLVFMGILSIPCGLLVLFAWHCQELGFRRKMRSRGRFLRWDDLERRLTTSPGTLIVQADGKHFPRVWWTEDDVPARSPLPPPRIGENCLPVRSQNPFVEWCYYHYLSEEKGKACLTVLPQSVHDWIASRDDQRVPPWKADYPLVQVVETGFVNRAHVPMIEKFLDILGADARHSVPELVAALRSDDPSLRCLAIHSLRLLGLAAQGAIPALVERLYDGARDERYDAALALARLGPVALELLKAASRRDDPWVSKLAELGLKYADSISTPALLDAGVSD